MATPWSTTLTTNDDDHLEVDRNVPTLQSLNEAQCQCWNVDTGITFTGDEKLPCFVDGKDIVEEVLECEVVVLGGLQVLPVASLISLPTLSSLWTVLFCSEYENPTPTGDSRKITLAFCSQLVISVSVGSSPYSKRKHSRKEFVHCRDCCGRDRAPRKSLPMSCIPVRHSAIT